MEGHDDLITQFVGITGAENHVAEHYLSACEWDLNRGVAFFFDHPPGDTSMPDAQADSDHEDLAVRGSGVASGPRPFPSFRPAAPQPTAHPIEDDDEDDDELQRALQASLREDTPKEVVDLVDEEEDESELKTMAARQQAAREARERRERERQAEWSGLGGSNRFPVFRPTMPPRRSGSGSGRPRNDPPRQRSTSQEPPPATAGPSSAPSAGPSTSRPSRSPPATSLSGISRSHSASRASAPSRSPPPATTNPRPSRSGHSPPRHSSSNPSRRSGSPPAFRPPRRPRSPSPHDVPDLPDGINLEEARMLEAAMLGIPYEGRIPEFREPQPESPRTMQARALVREQDDAYEESLRADRAKAAATAAAERARKEEEQRAKDAAEAAERKQREEEQAAARKAAEEAEKLSRSLSLKKMALPPEPESGDGEAVMVMVRLPDGGRKGRRFRRADALQAVFDYIDVESQAQSLKPGSYNLVTQFPRQVFSEGCRGSLQDAGLTAKQEALFLEMKS